MKDETVSLEKITGEIAALKIAVHILAAHTSKQHNVIPDLSSTLHHFATDALSSMGFKNSGLKAAAVRKHGSKMLDDIFDTHLIDR